LAFRLRPPLRRESNTVTQDNGGSLGLQEIIVTAEKRAQSVQEVPAAISALDAAEI